MKKRIQTASIQAQEGSIMKKWEPIREHDRLIDETGHIWHVCRVLPGGKVEIYDADRSRFSTMPHKTVRYWKRATS